MMLFIIAATAILTGSSVIYFYFCHQRLTSTVHHKIHCGTLSASTNPTRIETVPDAVFTEKYFTRADTASKPIPRACLPGNVSTEQLFNRLLRRNMQAFSRFPQALMLRMGAKTTEEKDSFSTSHITSLDFKKGDLVCGIYRVNLRKANKVEFDMQMKTVDFANGRLAISFSEEEDMIVFMSETIMWRRADECQIMPLERPAIQWMHETATMWLLDSGVRYLTDLEA